MNIIIFILVLLVVVIVHEYGHFFAARSMGMGVSEFAFGFPPKLFSFKRGHTTYSFNLIPLGGYVLIDGQDGVDEENLDPNKDYTKSFHQKTRLAQIWVLFAGPLMNIILAYVLIVGSYLGVNKVESVVSSPVVILEVVKGSPAEIAGVKAGDRISSIYIDGDIDPSYSPNIESVQDNITRSNGKDITLEVERNKETKAIEIKPTKDNENYKVGVSLGTLDSKKLPFGKALIEAGKDTYNITTATLKGFGQMFGKLFTGHSVKDSLMGPVGIAKQVGTVADFGFSYLLMFTAIISINLGVLNLLPLPALDGGRIVVTVIEAIRRKSFSKKLIGTIHTIGFFALIALLIFITILDVIKLFK